MISVHREWTLKWPPSPPPPSFLRALIKWGSPPHSISPMASRLPSLPVVPCISWPLLHKSVYFQVWRKGRRQGKRGTRMTPRGSLCLPSWHLNNLAGHPRATAQSTPATPVCVVDSGHPDPYETFGDSKLVFTLSLHLSP